MNGMTLEAMAKACRGKLIGGNERQFINAAGIVIDSRMVKADYVFVAIKGDNADGHDYIDQVFEKGALAVVSERELLTAKGPYILVKSTREALRDLAAYYRMMLDIKVVAVTGSVGKTSTKEIIASVLSEKYRVHKTEGNFNNEIGLPLTILKIKSHHQVAVLEMGISDFNEMHRLAEVAKPDVAVITNIGLCHLESLKTRDGILQAKMEMFDHLREGARVVLNGDDDKLCTVGAVQGREPVFYGIGEDRPKEAVYDKKQVYATDIDNGGLKGMRLTVHIGDESFGAKIPIPGEHFVYNALAAAAVGRILGLTDDEICEGLESAHTIDGRTNLIEVNGMQVIDDCYNANPVSMNASIDVLATAPGRTIAVLGDMGELGPDERTLHYSVGKHLAEKNIDVLFGVGVLTATELARAVKEHNSECEVYTFDTRDEMLRELLPFLRPGDSVLVKASHFMEFPEVVEEIITM